MYSYYGDAVWRLDAWLAGATIALIGATVVYMHVALRRDRRRTEKLIAVKRNIRDLSRSGRGPAPATCPAVRAENEREFLDVEMNREAILFNEEERSFVKTCFAEPAMLGKIRADVRRPGDKWARIEALLCLGYAGDAAAVPVMREAARSRDEDIRYYALLALGLLRTREAAIALLGFLGRRGYSVHKILSILEKFPPETADEAARLTENGDPSVRTAAIQLIAVFAPARHAGLIASLAADPVANVRAAACACLGRMAASGGKEHMPALIRCLKDGAWFVRMHAVRSLGRLDGDTAMREIVPLLGDRNLMVKEAVKSAMADHIRAAVPYLDGIFAGRDMLAKKEAVEALEVSGSLPELLRGLISTDAPQRSAALKLVKEIMQVSPGFGIGSALDALSAAERPRALDALKGVYPS